MLNAKSIKLDIDDAVFLDKSGLYRWELYYSFLESDLFFVQNGEELLGELYFHVKVSSNIKLENEKKWIVSHLKDINNVNENINLYGQKDFLLNAGQYKVNIYLQDLYDSTSFNELVFDLIIKDSKKSAFSLSSLELSQVISDTSNSDVLWNTSFIKNNSYVVPLPSLTFLATKQNLNSYIEFYKSTEQVGEDVVLEYRLMDSFDNMLYSEAREFSGSGKIINYDIASIPLSGYPSGIYYFKVKGFLKSNISDSVFVTKRFFLLNSEQKIVSGKRFLESQIFEKSEFSTLTPEQTEIEVAKIKPLATSEELSQFKLLSTTEAKQRMLFLFWQARDLDTTDAYNESLYKFKEMVKFAQSYFSYGKTPGWMTDRGKIVIKYGLPGNRLQYPFRADSRPYEEWFYEDIQGGVYFYFVDTFANGNYELVHSTANGEIQYDNWYNEYVLRNKSNQNNNDLRNSGW
jgi:GWxTD domain-containing protein